MRHFLLTAILLVLAQSPLFGQPVHMAPVPISTFSETDELLQIIVPAPGGTGFFSNTVEGVRVEDGRMYLMTMAATEVIDMRELTVAQLVEQLRGKYSGIQVYAPQPGLKTSDLREGTEEPTNRKFIIKGRRPRPTVRPELGVGLSLAEAADRESSGTLLRNIGLHLDLIGTKQFNWGTVRARIGLSNAPQTASKDSTGPEDSDGDGGDDTEAGSVSAFVESTQVVILGAHFDIPLWSFGGNEGAHLGFGLDLSNHYAGFERFTYDSIPVDGERRSAEEVFSAAEIGRASRILDRVRPVASFLFGPQLVFGTRDDYTFYILTETGYTEVYERTAGVRYRIDRETGVRTPFQLLPTVGSSAIWIGRVGIGVKLGNHVNIRADAVTPMWDQTDRLPPQLRLIVATSGLRFD